MDQGINPSYSRELSSYAAYDVDTPNTGNRGPSTETTGPRVPAAPAPAPIDITPVVSEPISPTRAEVVIEAIKKSGRKIDAAVIAVDQVRELMTSVMTAIQSNRELPGSELANRRMISSAHSAAKDIFDHASSDGKRLFSDAKPSDIRSSRAQNAYQKQQSSFLKHLGADDEPGPLAAAMRRTKDAVSGPKGLLSRMNELTNRHEDEDSLLNQIDKFRDELRSVKEDLLNARQTEIDPLNPDSENGFGRPFDLRA